MFAGTTMDGRTTCTSGAIDPRQQHAGGTSLGGAWPRHGTGHRLGRMAASGKIAMMGAGEIRKKPSAQDLLRHAAALVARNPIGRIAKRVLVWGFAAECWLAGNWASGAHRRLKLAQWSIPPLPRNVDHRIDLYSDWLRTRNPVWVERGVFNRLCLKGGDVLELTCGDGFNTRNFYSMQSRNILACDIDADIIRTARRKNAAPNIAYRVADIVRAFPHGRYQNVIWDFGYPITEFFSDDDLNGIFTNVRTSLDKGGVFSGYTMAEDTANMFTEEGPKGRMLKKEHLAALLAPYFSRVTVFETFSPGRRNFYFWASEGTVPFSEDWPAQAGGGARAGGG